MELDFYILSFHFSLIFSDFTFVIFYLICFHFYTGLINFMSVFVLFFL